ncbi:MAG: glycosyltransferase [Candidatus Aenigmatarchaeota archaeon]
MDATVVIPVWKVEKIIGDVLTALGACHGDFEILVVNDHSPDRTADIVRGFAGKDKRIKLIDNEGLKGPSGARNTGICHARGDRIIFLDSDIVVLTPDFVRAHVESGKQHQIVVGRTVPCKPNYLANVSKVGNENRSYFAVNNTSLPREIALANLFREDARLGTEDYELRNRLKAQNFDSYYCVDAVGKHVLLIGWTGLWKEGWIRGLTNVSVESWKSAAMFFGGAIYKSAKYTWRSRNNLKMRQTPLFYIAHLTGSMTFNLGCMIGRLFRAAGHPITREKKNA